MKTIPCFALKNFEGHQAGDTIDVPEEQFYNLTRRGRVIAQNEPEAKARAREAAGKAAPLASSRAREALRQAARVAEPFNKMRDDEIALIARRVIDWFRDDAHELQLKIIDAVGDAWGKNLADVNRRITELEKYREYMEEQARGDDR